MVPVAGGVQLRPRAPIPRGGVLHTLRTLWQNPNHHQVMVHTASCFLSCLPCLLLAVVTYLSGDPVHMCWIFCSLLATIARELIRGGRLLLPNPLDRLPDPPLLPPQGPLQPLGQLVPVGRVRRFRANTAGG